MNSELLNIEYDANNIWKFSYLDNNFDIIIGSILRQINSLIICCSAKKGSETNVTPITNNIWLGNLNIAADYDFIKNEIDVIINVSHENVVMFDNIEYHKIPMVDNNACTDKLINLIEYGADLLNYYIKNNKRVLVHCKRGHHRSASIIVMYFIKYHNYDLFSAIMMVKKNIPTAFRRISCMLQSIIIYYVLNKQI